MTFDEFMSQFLPWGVAGVALVLLLVRSAPRELARTTYVPRRLGDVPARAGWASVRRSGVRDWGDQVTGVMPTTGPALWPGRTEARLPLRYGPDTNYLPFRAPPDTREMEKLRG